MRKVEEKGGQVVSGLTKNRVEQNTIRLPLPPTTLWAGQFPSREDCDLKVRVHAGLAAGRAAKRPLQPVVRHDWIFPTF
jgi:hypothetical protein